VSVRAVISPESRRFFRSRGVSLVEVLVALVVLSVGMLGVAVLFVQSVRSSRSALLRTQAVNLVSDMGDRIRANAGAGAAYDTSTYGGVPASHGCAQTVGGSGSNCTPAQLAEDDLARWMEAVREALPGIGDGPPRAVVEYFPGRPEVYRISVAWHEPSEEQPFEYHADIVLAPRQVAAAGGP